jgi:CubicO group peptidase (beta-lactamase class C family)
MGGWSSPAATGGPTGEARRPVQPDSLFRIASLSKPLTAAAVLQLVAQGRLHLDDRAFDLLPDLVPRAGAHLNPDLRRITLRNLLQHSAGWDSERSFDPMFRSREIVGEMGVPPPADAETIVRYMLDNPLQFAPGTRYAYSNFGYCVLGRILERQTGERYESYVKAHILEPAGARCMRLGHSLLRDRAPGEVRYYGYPGIGLARSVFPSGPAQVPWPYGGWNLEAMDSHGAWLASAVDLARFVDAVDGRSRHRQILSAASIRQMVARPAPPLWQGTDSWYGMGWQVRPADGDLNWWHDGSLDGTTTLMVRAATASPGWRSSTRGRRAPTAWPASSTPPCGRRSRASRPGPPTTSSDSSAPAPGAGEEGRRRNEAGARACKEARGAPTSAVGLRLSPLTRPELPRLRPAAACGSRGEAPMTRRPARPAPAA